MSKIGRKGIEIESLSIDIVGDNELVYKGQYASGSYIVPDFLKLEIEAESTILKLFPLINISSLTKKQKELWGLHRALLASKLSGAKKLFSKNIKIVGLAYKAVLKGKILEFSLGYSHKKYYEVPEGVNVIVDRSGQKIELSSSDKELLGYVADKIHGLRPHEPYKGTGIMYENEKIRRKAGKTKK